MKSRFQRSLSAFAFTLFMGVGTYNSVVINSETRLDGSDLKFVRRLDELYGEHEPARLVAANIQWQKLTPEQVTAFKQKQVIQKVSTVDSSSTTEKQPQGSVAAVQEELELDLVEVVNPKKWQQGLAAAQFTGNLSTNKGTIENLAVSLPDGEGMNISFAEMTGNVFEYDMNGEIYSGMMYQVDQSSYMITLTNGPLEGTRLKFAGSTQAQVEAQEEANVASMGTNSESDNLGQPSDAEIAAADQQLNNPTPQTIQAEESAPVPEQQIPEGAVPLLTPEQMEIAYQQHQAFLNGQDPAELDQQFQQQAQAMQDQQPIQ